MSNRAIAKILDRSHSTINA
ncbi:MAG: helix-turn-helix domain-containing protein [Lactobacillales bacterium]|nr:helix-turn-helix domain-containing protein [Lactobacillales bacterium]